MTTNEAKKLLREYLTEFEIPFTKLTAKTVGFSDLARGDCVFVQVHGFSKWAEWVNVKCFAGHNGFCVESV